MRRSATERILKAGASLAAALALALACSTDSPTAPRQEPPPPPGSTPASATWNITLSANPGELTAGSNNPATINIQVRRASDGQPPPNGATIAVTTSLGEFGSFGSGLQSAVVALLGGAGQVVLFPGSVPGTAVVTAQLEGSVGQIGIPIRGGGTFFVASVSPNVGSPQGGETVSVLGEAFDPPARVLFGGRAAEVLSVTATRIRVVTPPAPDPQATTQQTVNVSVTINLNEEGAQTDTLVGGFTFSPGGGVLQPAIFSLSPASGPNEGGTRVRILGDGFEAPVQVIFGANTQCSGPATGVEAVVESVSRTEIVAITPSATNFGQDNRNQAVNVLVRNLGSGLCTVATQAFRYGVPVLITAISPGQGDFRGGTLVTIFGQGFEAPVAVSMGGIGQSVVSVTGSEIVIRTSGITVADCPPSGQVDGGIVRVVNINSGDGAEGPSFTYTVPLPRISSISPTSGPQGGGTGVTISGSSFEAPVRVLFGDQAASVGTVSPTSVSVTTPTFTGTFQTQSCDDDGDGTVGTKNVPTSVDVTVINLATGCEDTFPNAFTYNPSDTSCQGDAGAGPPPQCNDGFDNDGDTFIDAADPQCTGPTDNDEST